MDGDKKAPAPVALTPAQQYADELVVALRGVMNLHTYKIHTASAWDGLLKRARAVLAAIEATGQEGAAPTPVAQPLTVEEIARVLAGAGFDPDEFTDTRHELEVRKPDGSASWVVVLTRAAPAPVVQPRKPMTFDDAGEIAKSAESAMSHNPNLSWRMALIRATEAFHGITKGEA